MVFLSTHPLHGNLGVSFLADNSRFTIVAKVKADAMEKVKETITWKIRRLDRVRSTLTMIVVEG